MGVMLVIMVTILFCPVQLTLRVHQAICCVVQKMVVQWTTEQKMQTEVFTVEQGVELKSDSPPPQISPSSSFFSLRYCSHQSGKPLCPMDYNRGLNIFHQGNKTNQLSQVYLLKCITTQFGTRPIWHHNVKIDD